MLLKSIAVALPSARLRVQKQNDSDPWSGFNLHPGHVIASLDKTLYDDYLCLVALNKQQTQRTKFEEIHMNIGSPKASK